MEDERVQQVREQATEIVRRAQSDDTFRQQLLDSPEETLRAEGLPDDAADQFRDELAGSDVEGYAGGLCIPLTCLISCMRLTSGGGGCSGGFTRIGRA